MKEKGARAGGYKGLLDDKSLKRWYDNVSRGSQVTADVYLRRLGHLCNDLKTTPQELVAMKEEQLYELFLDIVSRMEREGRSGSYILSQLKAVKSWLVHNRIEVKGKIKIRGVQDTPTLKDERVPTKAELKRVFLAGDEKARVACALVAHCGLRLESLGTYRGNDGLRLGDLPETVVKDQTVEFLKIPALVVVRRQLSKAGHQYFTFLSEEACGYLKDYLEFRMRKGEALSPDSPVVTPKQPIKPFIRTTNIGDMIRESIRRAGFPWRPYVLRSYFDTQLMLAESKGLVLRDYRQFWMGHKGDMEARYTTNKGRLPEEVKEDMRGSFRKCEDYLSTRPASREEDQEMTTIRTMVESGVLDLSKANVRAYLLKKLGVEDMEVKIAKLKRDGLAEEEAISNAICGELGIKPMKIETSKTKNDRDPKKIVNEQELGRYLEKGWEYQTTLPSGKILIRKDEA
jgi:hypothetical protein